MTEDKRLLRMEKQLTIIAKEQAVSSVLLADYNRLLKEHMKRTEQIEHWMIEHKSSQGAKWTLIKDFGILLGIGVALARLFGLI